jgi:hypothetical protein
VTCALLMAISCGSDTTSNKSSGAGGDGDGDGGDPGSSSGGKSSTAGTMSGAGEPSAGGMPGGGGAPSGQAGEPETTEGGSDTGAGGNTAVGEGGAATVGHGGASGDSGQAGAGGAGCGDVIEPTCDDSDADSIDFYSERFATCGHWFGALGGSGGWVVYGAVGAPSSQTLSFDVSTGLGWAHISGSRNQADAALACAGLTRLGLFDWRLATIDEARTLAGGCASTIAGGPCAVADPGCLAMSCNQGIECQACPGGDQSLSLREDDQYCRPEVTLCTLFQTSSNCSDCPTAESWRYGPTNGNLLPLDVLSSVTTICTMPGVPGAPCLDPNL